MPNEASKQNAQWDPYEDESSPGETIREGDGVQRRTSQLVALAKKNIAEKEAREKEARDKETRAQRIEQMKQRMRDVTGMENADPNVESGKKRKGLALSRCEDSGEFSLSRFVRAFIRIVLIRCHCSQERSNCTLVALPTMRLSVNLLQRSAV